MVAVTAAADPVAVVATTDTQPLVRISPSVMVGAESFHYAEEVQAPLKSAHDAWLPTIRAAVDADALSGHLFGRLVFTASDGSMTYDGSTQNGAPVSGHTSGNLTDSELDVGSRFHAGPVLLGGYVGAGHHTWNRNFSEVMSGYREEYSWNYLPVAVEAGLSLHQIDLRVEAAYLLTFVGTNHASLSDVSAMYNDVDLPIATGGATRVSVHADYPVTDALRVVAMFSYQNDIALQGPAVAFTYKDGSAVTDTNGNPLYASYPGAKTTREAIMLGASYGF